MDVWHSLIESGGCTGLGIKLTCAVHNWIHVFHAVLWVGILVSHFHFMIFKHYWFCQIYILIILSWAEFFQWAHKWSWWVHFFHYLCHVLRSCIFNCLFLHYISWNPAFIFWFKCFVFHELGRHNSINFSEILQNSKSRIFFFSRHKLTYVVIRVQWNRCTSRVIKCLAWLWTCSDKASVFIMHILNNCILCSRSWTSKQIMPLSQELWALKCALNFLIIIKWCLIFLFGNIVVLIGHRSKRCFTFTIYCVIHFVQFWSE